jgi:XisH protein
VINALVKDGWLITDDPLSIKWGQKDLYIDLGAEELVAAEKGPRQIAVEIKSFIGSSEVEDLKNALGAHILYHDVLAVVQPQRQLYVAIREEVYYALFEEPIGRILLENQRIQLILFDPAQEVIVRWIP